MAANRITRKVFRKALVEAELSLSEWTRRNKVSRTHLYEVLDGNRTPSDELLAKIEATVKEAA